MLQFLLPFLLLLSFNFLTNDAKIIEGSINEQDDWIYFTKFCFENNGGEIRYELIFNVSQCQSNILKCLSLAFYHDENEVFRKLYVGSKKNELCSAKVESPYLDNSSQLIHMDPSPWSKYPFGEREKQCKIMADEETINCTGFRNIYTMRPRWWFLALANCENGDEG